MITTRNMRSTNYSALLYKCYDLLPYGWSLITGYPKKRLWWWVAKLQKDV